MTPKESRHSRSLAWPAILLSRVACEPASPPAPPVAPPRAPVPSASAAVAAPTVTPACPTAPVDEHECLAFAPALALARSLATSKDLVCAGKVFDAIVADRPGNPRVLAERAYVRFLAGSNDLDEFDLALALVRWEAPDARSLAAAIWFNKAAVYRRRGDADLARIALVLAERLGSTAATTELGTASRCTATWGGLPTEPAPIAKGWHDLALRRFAWGKCDSEEPPAGAAASKKYACRGCVVREDMGEPPDASPPPDPYGDVCQGASGRFSLDDCTGWDGPWDSFDVEYLPGGRFYYEITPIEGRMTLSHRVEAGVLMVETSEPKGGEVPGSDAFAGRANDAAWGIQRDEDAGPPCESGSDLVFQPRSGACSNHAVGPGWGGGSIALYATFSPHRRAYYDLATRKPLFQITVWDGDPPGLPRKNDVVVTFDRSNVTVAGLGCFAVVPRK